MKNTVLADIIHVNACVARGGWVPRNLEAGAADPEPKRQEHPKSLPYLQPSHEPRPPYLAPAPYLALIRLVLTEIQRFKNVKIDKEMYGYPYVVLLVYSLIYQVVNNVCILK